MLFEITFFGGVRGRAEKQKYNKSEIGVFHVLSPRFLSIIDPPP